MYHKAIFFLDSNDKRKIYYLFALFIFIGVIEVAGVLSIMPFVGMITNPEYFGSISFSTTVKEYLLISDKELTLLFGSLFIILFISCSILNALTIWLNTRLSAVLGEKISSKLFKHYLCQPYDFFVKNDIASLSKNIIQISVSLSESIFIPALQIITRVIILIFISILLININVFAFIGSLSLLGLIYLFIFRKIKYKLVSYGKERLVSNDLLFKSTTDCLNSIKDVKFYNVENYFNNIFTKSQRNFLDLTAKNIIFSTLPRYIVEIVAFGTIFITLLYMQYYEMGLSQYSPTIALFVLAAYRLLPSIQQIFAFTSSIRFNLPALDLIYKDMHIRPLNIPKHEIKNIDYEVIFNNINFSYENNTNILQNINIKFPGKTYNALIGESGSGKTTLIDLLLGLYKPQSGKIYLSTSLYDQTNDKLLIGYVSQNSPFIDDSILNNIVFGLEIDPIMKGNNRVFNLIDICGLSDLIKSLPDGIDTRVGEKGSKLSGGQLQRIAIARALYRNPKLLILDEATNALDTDTEKKIFKSLKSNYSDMTVICITHRLETMKECENVFHISSGIVEQISDKNKKISDEELNQLSNRYTSDEK